MAISYRDFTWENLPLTGTPLSAANLNEMEAGIKAACDELDARPVVRAAALTSDFTGTQGGTTLENVTGLSITVAANEILTFKATLLYSTTEDNDAKIGFAFPTGATLKMTNTLYSTAGNVTGAVNDLLTTTSSPTSLVVGAGLSDGAKIAHFDGVLINSTNAGTLQAMLANNASVDATDIKMLAGSIIRAEVWT